MADDTTPLLSDIKLALDIDIKSTDKKLVLDRRSDALKHLMEFRNEFPTSPVPLVYVYHATKTKGNYHCRAGCSRASIGISLEIAATQKRRKCTNCWTK